MTVGILMNYRYLLKLLLRDLKRNYDKNPNTGKQETGKLCFFKCVYLNLLRFINLMRTYQAD